MLLHNIYLENRKEEYIQRRLREWQDSDQSEWINPDIVLTIPNVYLEVLFKYQNLIKDLKDIEVFIETGTEEGGTTDIMAKHFKEVYTIDNIVFDSSRRKLHQEDEKNENVKWILGNSPKVLEWLNSKIENHKCVFLLDAHTGNSSCLEDELKVIKKFYNKNSVLIIDDAIDIGVRKEYPTLNRFKELIYDINQEYNILFTDLGRRICLVY